jgi:molybdopterin-guanine dinucleotide biosynthesis protein A
MNSGGLTGCRGHDVFSGDAYDLMRHWPDSGAAIDGVGEKVRRRPSSVVRDRSKSSRGGWVATRDDLLRGKSSIRLQTNRFRVAAQGSILGVILAGGKSTRMGVDKALVDLNGRPLIAHAIERLRPQVDAMTISANGELQRFAPFALPILSDAAPDRDAGPLAGVAAALAFARSEGWTLVATAPCDAPFAPADFIARLAEAMGEQRASLALAEGRRGDEPLFALWRVDQLAPLRDYLSQGGRAPRDFMRAKGAARARFADGEGEDPFANLNSPAELELARAKSRES